MAASLGGVWEEWKAHPEIRHRCERSVRQLVKTVDGGPIALQNRSHALLNIPLIDPILRRMADSKTLVVNTVDELCVQIVCFAASLYDQKGIDETNAFHVEFEDGDMDDIRVLAMGLKRCVAYIRKLYIRQHVLQD